MKKQWMVKAACGAALAAVALGIAGCASQGYEKGSATAEGLKASAAKIESAQSKLDATVTSLNDLVNKPAADLRPQYKAFSDNVTELEKLAKHGKEGVVSMGAKSKEFFAKWDEETAAMKNEDIKNRSAARKQEVTAALNDIKRCYVEAETAFKPFMSNLRDIQKYLGTDLTTAGVASIKDVAVKANTDAAALKEPLAKLVASFKALGVSMSAAAPAPEPAK